MRIAYHGGSAPGSFRDILPLAVDDRTVRARCYTSGTVKAFSIGKMELLGVDEQPTAPGVWTPRQTAELSAGIDAVAEIHAAHYEALKLAGWHVEFLDGPDAASISLFAKLKNGNLRKTPSLILSHEGWAWDLTANSDGTLTKENLRPRARPWSVRGSGGASAGTWARPEKAVEVFLQEAIPASP